MFLYPAGIRSFINRKVSIRAGDRILDAGCGFGILSKAIHEKAVRAGLSDVEQHAFDISPHMLEEFRKQCRFAVVVQQLDVRQLPYPDEYFELILTAAMLEYVDIEGGLASLRRVLRPGGCLYVFMSRDTALNRSLFQPFGNPKCYAPSELRAILEKLGFSTVEQQSFPPRFFWLNLWGYVLKAVK